MSIAWDSLALGACCGGGIVAVALGAFVIWYISRFQVWR